MLIVRNLNGPLNPTGRKLPQLVFHSEWKTLRMIWFRWKRSDQQVWLEWQDAGRRRRSRVQSQPRGKFDGSGFEFGRESRKHSAPKNPPTSLKDEKKSRKFWARNFFLPKKIFKPEFFFIRRRVEFLIRPWRSTASRSSRPHPFLTSSTTTTAITTKTTTTRRH